MTGKILPSLLSASRIVFAPFVVVSIMRGEMAQAVYLLMVAGSTDFFDGFLARRYHWQTRTGEWMDGVADKTLLSAVFIALALAGVAPLWLVYLIFGRDLLILLMAVIGLLFTPIRDFPPSVWGKLSTSVQIVTALGMLLGLTTGRNVLIGACATATAWSGAHYFYSAVKRLRALGSRTN